MPYRSTSWPSAKRKKSMPWTSSDFPVGGMPKNGPVCVPVHVVRAQTPSPSAISRRQVRRAGPGNPDAERLDVLGQRRSGRTGRHGTAARADGRCSRRRSSSSRARRHRYSGRRRRAQSVRLPVLREQRRIVRIGRRRRPREPGDPRCPAASTMPAAGGMPPIWLRSARMSGWPQCSTILPSATRKIPCEPHVARVAGRRRCP